MSEEEIELFWSDVCGGEFDFALEVLKSFEINSKKLLCAFEYYGFGKDSMIDPDYDMTNKERNLCISYQKSIIHRLCGSVNLLGFVTFGRNLSYIEESLKKDGEILSFEIVDNIKRNVDNITLEMKRCIKERIPGHFV